LCGSSSSRSSSCSCLRRVLSQACSCWSAAVWWSRRSWLCSSTVHITARPPRHPVPPRLRRQLSPALPRGSRGTAGRDRDPLPLAKAIDECFRVATEPHARPQLAKQFGFPSTRQDFGQSEHNLHPVLVAREIAGPT